MGHQLIGSVRRDPAGRPEVRDAPDRVGDEAAPSRVSRLDQDDGLAGDRLGAADRADVLAGLGLDVDGGRLEARAAGRG